MRAVRVAVTVRRKAGAWGWETHGPDLLRAEPHNRSRRGRALLYTCLLKLYNSTICFPQQMGTRGGLVC